MSTVWRDIPTETLVDLWRVRWGDQQVTPDMLYRADRDMGVGRWSWIASRLASGGHIYAYQGRSSVFYELKE